MKTRYIKEIISKCEDIEELSKEIHSSLIRRPEQWSTKVKQILKDNGYTKTVFAKLCGVSRVTVDKWCKGVIPKNRETFLRIGLVANYDRVRMNHLLQRYGRYPSLYAKSLEDCVCIYVLNHYSTEDRMGRYYYILNKIRENIIKPDVDEAEDEETVLFEEKLSNVQSEEELDYFIEENIRVFASAYHKFYSYVKRYVEDNSILDFNYNSKSVNHLEERMAWSSSLRQCVSSIRQEKWYPTRNKIISLGMHLSMDHRGIDKMLKYANMEPLCAKNIAESVIIFILDDASLNNMLDFGTEDFAPEDLCAYARKVLNDPALAEIKAEVEDFISELSETGDEE